jgi:hypothetical protein
LDGAAASKLVGQLRARWAAWNPTATVPPRRVDSERTPAAFKLDHEPRPVVPREDALRIAKAFEDAIHRRR